LSARRLLNRAEHVLEESANRRTSRWRRPAGWRCATLARRTRTGVWPIR